MFCIGNLLLQLFALDGFVGAFLFFVVGISQAARAGLDKALKGDNLEYKVWNTKHAWTLLYFLYTTPYSVLPARRGSHREPCFSLSLSLPPSLPPSLSLSIIIWTYALRSLCLSLYRSLYYTYPTELRSFANVSGGRHRLPVPNNLYGLCGRKATLNDEHAPWWSAPLWVGYIHPFTSPLVFRYVLGKSKHFA